MADGTSPLFVSAFGSACRTDALLISALLGHQRQDVVTGHDFA
jgi:hypothetical protein